MTVRFRFGPATVDILADRAPEDVAAEHYAPFVAAGGGTADLTIRISPDPPPARPAAIPVAHLPNDWELYATASGYRLEILDQATFTPRQVVLLQGDLREATFYSFPHPGTAGLPRGSWHLPPVMNPFVQWWLTAWLAIGARGVVLHASAVALDGAGFAFVGPSGAGKTTMSRLCRDRAGAVVLNDERIVVWSGPDGISVGGTPWHGELAQVSPITVPLGGLFVLAQADATAFSPWPPARSVPVVVSEAFLPIWNRDAMAGLLAGVEHIVARVPTGELRFSTDGSVAELLRSWSIPAPAASAGLAAGAA